MSRERERRRLRIILDVERRPLSEEQRARMLESVRRTPNAVQRDYDSAWLYRLGYEKPADELPGDEIGTPMAKGEGDEQLPKMIERIEGSLDIELRSRLSDEEIPLDPRFSELVGTPRLIGRAELARSVALLLGLSPPHSATAEDLLVGLALRVHRFYFEFNYSYDDMAIGSTLVSAVSSALEAEQFNAALNDLGVDEVGLWSAAADLVRRMGSGFPSRFSSL